MAVVNDRKMHSMACALERAEHAELRAIGFCNHQNKFNFTTIPSDQHFKAFPMSKFNSKTSFLYHLFKNNSNFIVFKPCKFIYLSIFYYYLYLFISLLMHIYLYFNEKNLKPCKMFIYVCMYVCMFACVYNFNFF